MTDPLIDLIWVPHLMAVQKKHYMIMLPLGSLLLTHPKVGNVTDLVARLNSFFQTPHEVTDDLVVRCMLWDMNIKAVDKHLTVSI